MVDRAGWRQTFAHPDGEERWTTVIEALDYERTLADGKPGLCAARAEFVALIEQSDGHELLVSMGINADPRTEVFFRASGPGELSCKVGR